MRILRLSSISLAVGLFFGWNCAPAWTQEFLNAPPAQVAPLWNADSTSLDGCQIIARIDNQIVLACEVQWL
ncbi:MAG TPA: hypothetical protein VHK01_02140, partial [Lacipirellulaceae bacterium]|nr:hypothetical protein [Lacipirellulaceae bacterium]